MLKLFVSLVDGLMELYMSSIDRPCSRPDSNEDSCYSAGLDVTCRHCTVLVLFTALRRALEDVQPDALCPLCNYYLSALETYAVVKCPDGAERHAHNHCARKLRLEEAIAKLPAAFGLKAFDGTFHINPRDSSITHDGVMMLAIDTEAGLSFGRWPVDEILLEVVPASQ